MFHYLILRIAANTNGDGTIVYLEHTASFGINFEEAGING